MRTFCIWISGVLTVTAIVHASHGEAWRAVLDTALSALNLYAGTRK